MTWTSLSRSSSTPAFFPLGEGLGLVDATACFAFSSHFFFRACFARSSGFELLLKRIDLPSGDHFGLLAPFGKSVKTKASPPDIGRRQSCDGCFLPSFSRARVN